MTRRNKNNMSDIALLIANEQDKAIQKIAQKVEQNERINNEEALYLFTSATLSALSVMATHRKQTKSGNHVYFNRNFHIEPTNYCVFSCKFCSYSRTFKEKDETTWFYTVEEMMDIVKKWDNEPVTEVHIVGGVHPKLNLHAFGELLTKIKQHRPLLHIKAFTAVELEYMIRKAKLTYREGLEYLKNCGLDSLPGGGAEIFDESVRAEICGDKCTSEQWLEIHQTAHELGIPSNATMLYGHYETYTHRIQHMDRLRDLQDKTNGFNTFIPLKFRNKHNEMSHLPEVATMEDLRNYAVSRIYLDNFNHIKAYWPMIGRNTAQMSIQFGVDDMDGTIDDTTKIYTMAGSEEQTPAITTRELCQLILDAKAAPIERDTLYNTVTDYSNHQWETDIVGYN